MLREYGFASEFDGGTILRECPHCGQFCLCRVALLKKEAEWKELVQDKQRLDWIDKHCSFVPDAEYLIKPYKIGELRKMADDGIAQETCICMDCGKVIKVNEQNKHEKECSRQDLKR